MNQTLITILSATATLVIGWVLSRKKAQAEVRKVTAEAVQLEIGNARAVINFWKETAESLTITAETLTIKLEHLSNKCDELIAELELVRSENAELKKKLEQIQQKV